VVLKYLGIWASQYRDVIAAVLLDPLHPSNKTAFNIAKLKPQLFMDALIVAAAPDKPPAMRKQALAALAEDSTDASAQTLLAIATSDDPLRNAAIECIAAYRSREERFAPLLTQILQDPKHPSYYAVLEKTAHAGTRALIKVALDNMDLNNMRTWRILANISTLRPFIIERRATFYNLPLGSQKELLSLVRYDDSLAVQWLRQGADTMPKHIHGALSSQLREAARSNHWSLIRMLQDDSSAVFNIAVEVIAAAPANYQALMDRTNSVLRERILQHLPPAIAAMFEPPASQAQE
jgi:hypothetical protein